MEGSSERFQALIENSADAISLVNPDGRVLYANASTANVLGYRPEELLGQNGLDLLHPQDRDHSVRALKTVLAEPQRPKRTQVRVRRKDGEWRWVESTASNLLDEPHVGAIVVNYREISTRRAEEEARQRLAEELIRANAELVAFAHTVAHDLREPLRTISAFTSILTKKVQLDKDHEKIAGFIQDGVQKMSLLLESLLSSATGRFNDSLGPVKLDHAAAQAIQNLHETLTSSGARITMDRLPTVRGNESNLVRVFQNLISNAVKYRSEEPVEIFIHAERLGPDWVVKVRDNGIGIQKEHQLHVFGLFTRLNPEEIPGTGIGLALCKKVVEQMGGGIWVESQPGAGSTFCFTIGTAGEQEEPAKIRYS